MYLKDLVLFGAQGSGKGTQARMLEEHFIGQYRYFESGAIMRALESNDNAIGAYVKSGMDQGKLVEDSLVVALFDAFYVTLQSGQAMIVDGFPRNVPQMHSFLDRMYRYKRTIMGLWIDVPKDIAIEQLDVKTMKGRENVYRRRIGDYRIMYTIFDTMLIILILDIDSRGEIYKKR